MGPFGPSTEPARSHLAGVLCLHPTKVLFGLYWEHSRDAHRYLDTSYTNKLVNLIGRSVCVEARSVEGVI